LKKVNDSYDVYEKFDAQIRKFIRWWFERLVVEIERAWPPSLNETEKQFKFLYNFAFLFFKENNPKSIHFHKRYVELSEKLSGADDMTTLEWNVRLAMVYINVGQYSKTLQPMRKAIEGAVNTLPENPTPEHIEKVFKWVDIVVKMLTGGNMKNAIALEKEVSRARQKVGDEKLKHVKDLHKACEYCRSKKFDKALPLLDDLLKRVTHTQGETAPLAMAAMKNLVQLYIVQKKNGEASELADKFIKIAKTIYGETSSHVLDMMNMQGKIFNNKDMPDEATKMFNHVIDLGTSRIDAKYQAVLNARYELDRMKTMKEKEEREKKEREEEEKKQTEENQKKQKGEMEKKVENVIEEKKDESENMEKDKGLKKQNDENLTKENAEREQQEKNEKEHQEKSEKQKLEKDEKIKKEEDVEEKGEMEKTVENLIEEKKDESENMEKDEGLKKQNDESLTKENDEREQQEKNEKEHQEKSKKQKLEKDEKIKKEEDVEEKKAEE